ncbi:MAG TPA: imidazolonepropionase [Solimonas sp.]|nr:imidazolonepropionase [Solimonas sp.]
MQIVDLLIHNASQVATCASGNAPRRKEAMRDVGLIEDGAIAISGERIVAVGSSTDLRANFRATRQIDVQGCAVVPGLVDCHTHAVYAGHRIAEFEQRIAGRSYQEIAASGGGIAATMRATRAAPLAQIVAESRQRLDQMLRLGTTTAEVKTGYGLSTAAELKQLEAIETLDRNQPLELVPTFLGAHALPPEYRGRGDDYIELVNGEMLAAVGRWYCESRFAVRGTPLFADVFCERNAFDLAQSRRVLEAAEAAGLRLKAHVDEFSDLGGLAMALELGAVSVDHLDVTGEAGIRLLAASNTIGVVIPTVNFNFGSREFANARGMIDAGCAIALTTDINPGSAPCPSLPLAMAIACRYQRLLPAEALNAATINAAHAVGLAQRIGSLEAGKQADFVILDAPDYRCLAYEFGGNRVATVIKRGEVVHERH